MASSSASSSEPTRGQLERTLSQRIQALYREQLGHRPEQIVCNIVDNQVVVLMEDAITQPEQLLAENGNAELAAQVRVDLDKAFQPQLQATIEEIVGVAVLDIIGSAKLETGRFGTIVILESAPKLRSTTSRAKLQS